MFFKWFREYCEHTTKSLDLLNAQLQAQRELLKQINDKLPDRAFKDMDKLSVWPPQNYPVPSGISVWSMPCAGSTLDAAQSIATGRKK